MNTPKTPPPVDSNSPTRARDEDARAYKFDDERRAIFLHVLEQHGQTAKAARAAGVSATTAYDHRNRDKDFNEAWAEALEHFRDRLEVEAYRRAVDGVDEPVYQQGMEVGVVRRFSDSLLTLLLKGHRPERYRERVDQTVNVSNAHGVLMVSPPARSVAEWVEGDEKK